MNARTTRLLRENVSAPNTFRVAVVAAFVLYMVGAAMPAPEVRPMQVSWSIDARATEGNVVDMTY
jgi:hypothetical protein